LIELSEKKYSKYFITVPAMEKLAFGATTEKVLGKTDTRVYMSEELVNVSDTHIVHIGIIDMPSTNPFTEDHVHPFNAIMLLVGLDMDDPEDLGGEIEYILGEEGELHRTDKSNAIFLPAGFKHNLRFLRVDRPFLLIAVNLSGAYG
jgi:hypothetical protein